MTPGSTIIGTNTMSVTAVDDITESFNSRIAKSTAMLGLYQSLVFLVVSSMMTSVRSMAIPNERTSEKLVMKLSDNPIQLSVRIDIINASGIVIAAISDSFIPMKKNTHAKTRIMVCTAFHPRLE